MYSNIKWQSSTMQNSNYFCTKLVIENGGNGNPLQYCCLQYCWPHGVTKSWTRLSNFTFTFHFHALEKEMATQSSVIAWRIPRTGEPGGLPSVGSHRVGHDWSDLAAAAAAVIEDSLGKSDILYYEFIPHLFPAYFVPHPLLLVTFLFLFSLFIHVISCRPSWIFVQWLKALLKYLPEHLVFSPQIGHMKKNWTYGLIRHSDLKH